jgi:tryptophan halogenase
MHYYLNERSDSDFWRELQTMDVPERLGRKIELFRSNGTLSQDQLDIFLEPSWLQVMLGQGVMPQDYHPLANVLTDEQLRDKLNTTLKTKQQPLAQIPAHVEFLSAFCKTA